MIRKITAMLLSVCVLVGCTAGEQEIFVPTVEVDVQITSSAATAAASESTTKSQPVSAISCEISESDEQSTQQRYSSVDIVCAGDNLIHSNIYNQANVRAGGTGYDFSYPYQYVRPYIQRADLAILNQETIITDEFPPSNYPRFCTPSAMGDEMVELGFDAVSVSNNHIIDQGEEGLLATLDYWRKNHPNIPVYGAYESAADMARTRNLTVNGIRFAFLGYMEHTNGLSLPKNSQCELVYLSELETIERQIKAAAREYDCVIVSVHFGVEITNKITKQQYNLAQKFADWGADIIIGTQPHTIQSMEYLDRADGGKSFVFYCLGNFLSSQEYVYSMVEILGGITVTKDFDTGEITLENPKAVPLINHYDHGYSNVRVYPYRLYNKKLAASHGCEGGITMEFINKLINENIPVEYLAY